VSRRIWEIASKFGHPENGMKKAENIKSEGDGKREVLYRDISRHFHSCVHAGYDPAFAWVEKVAKDIA
jgi:hypothetical protein